MGTSITNWNGVAEYFVFAHNPGALMLFSAAVLTICISLIAKIKHHEDQSFKNFNDDE